MYDVAELDSYPRVGDHYMINGHAYHMNVIFECAACREGWVCLTKHNEHCPKKRTFMLMCGVHTHCDAWKE